MAPPVRLTDDEIDAALRARPGWELKDAKLHREVQFAGFPEALAFMVRVGVAAEVANHHPEWSNVYNRVTIDLTTHDAGGITAGDLALADVIDTASP